MSSRNTILIYFLVSTFLRVSGQEVSAPGISYVMPYEYYKAPDGYVVKAVVSLPDAANEPNFQLDGKGLECIKKDSNRFEMFLPLVGETMQLKFTKNLQGKTKQGSFLFEPLISADWGYFKNGKVHIICSSHQDIAWMNTPDSCRLERVHDIVIPALDIIEKEPAFKFEMEQCLNLMEVLEDEPLERQRIIEAYKSDNFEWGATFNQPYEGLESGEQLVRQTYLGRKWIKDNLPGMDAKVAYNIDVPGRSIQVPQIFNKAGIDYLFVSRMKEGFYDWYSPDGSKILTYSPGNYGWSLLFFKYLEEDAITSMHRLNEVIKNWDNYYREHNLPPHYAIVISTDAGGPKYYNEVINGWNEIAENCGFEIPLIQHSTAKEFLDEINVPEARFDSISGERPNLWIYIHGASHYEAIKAKKEAAVHIPAAEIFNTINCQLKGDFSDYPQEELNKAWFNSIYPDHGWGGKNGEITDSIFRVTLEQGNDIGKKLLYNGLEDISRNIDLKSKQNIIIYNDLSWERSGNVKIDISKLPGDNWLVAETGKGFISSQLIKNGKEKELVFCATNVPSVGYKTYHLVKGKSEYADGKVGTNYCENDYYKITFGKGGITTLFDKELGVDLINSTRFAAGDLLHMGYDGNGAGEFVQITEPNVTDYEKLHEKEASWELKETGPVLSVFQATYQMTGFEVIQTITVYHRKKQIDFEYDIPDWKGPHNRQLRVAFPMNMKEDAQVSYDVPMGMLHVGKDELSMRPKGWAWGGTYRQMPKEIHPREIQNFMTISDNQKGVTVSTNVVTADWIDPSRESADYPVMNFVLLSTHKSCHGLGNWYHQTGSHHFKFSLSSHLPGWKNGYHFGVEGNHPFYSIKHEAKQKGELPAEKSFVSISNPFAVVTTIKKAENSDDVIIRLVEAENENKEVNIDFGQEVERFFKTNLIEENPEEKIQKGNTVRISLNKNSIETYKLKFNTGEKSFNVGKN